MKIADALELKPGDTVSFVGAGGKTTSLFRLASELVEKGLSVISTTTTRLAQSELALSPKPLSLGARMQLPASLRVDIEKDKHVLIYSKLTSDGKVQGVRTAWLDKKLASHKFSDIVLIEADGSRRQPLKAPLPHEPPVPASSTVVVPVVGLSVLGLPLNPDSVYGAEIVNQVLGTPFDTPVSEELVAAILMHPQLGLKAIPRRARIVPLLNQVTPDNMPQARLVASYMLTDLNVERVLLGAVKETDPIIEIRRRVGAIILAAGQSSRMGKPKLLLPWGDSTIIRRVCQQVLDCGLDFVVLVAGDLVNEIYKQIAGLPIEVVQNPDSVKGEMLSSLKIGLDTLWNRCDACLIVLGDQPSLDPEIVRQLLNAYAQGKGRIVAPSYENQRGHPLLIDRMFWQAIMDLPQGKAPRDVLHANEKAIHHVVVHSDSVLADIDTPEDYENAKAASKH